MGILGASSLTRCPRHRASPGPLQSYMSQPPSGSEPLRSNVVPYGEVHSTPEVMADISATPSSEKMTNLITDSSCSPSSSPSLFLDQHQCQSPQSRFQT